MFVRGEAEFAIAALMNGVGLSQDEATATFLVASEEHGMADAIWEDVEVRVERSSRTRSEACLCVRVGDRVGVRDDYAFRLCEDCAAKTGVIVSRIDDDEHPYYEQPEDDS